MNQITVSGRLTRDPELTYTTSGKAVTKFAVAVDAGSNKPADFLDVVVWEKQAENCAKFLIKGQKAYVSGRLSTRTWETNDGQKRKSYEIVAHNVEFGEKPKGHGQDQEEQSDGGYSGGGQQRERAASGWGSSPPQQQSAADDDIPF